MEFVILDKNSIGVPIALRLQSESYKVFYADEDNKGNDLITMKKQYKTLIINLTKKAELLKDKLVVIVYDNHTLTDKLIKAGYKVIGNDSCLDALGDYKTGLKTMKQCSIKPVESYEFKTVDKALKFLKTQPKNKIFAIKDCSAYAGDNNQELISDLDCYRAKIKCPFTLEQSIKGIKCNITGWFNGNKFVGFNGSLMYNRESTGNLGKLVDCAGEVVWVVNPESRIVKDGISKIEPVLKVNKLPCVIGLRGIVGNKGLLGISWETAKYSLSLIDLFTVRLGEILYTLANGVLVAGHLGTKQAFGASVRVVSDDGVEFITGNGVSIDDAAKDMYDKVDKLKVSDKDYRVDICQQAKSDYNNLLNLGWIL